jgi:hypothetical protein
VVNGGYSFYRFQQDHASPRTHSGFKLNFIQKIKEVLLYSYVMAFFSEKLAGALPYHLRGENKSNFT